MSIYFYNKNEPYYEFTNFYKAKIVVDNITYLTSEHFYQCSKFSKSSKEWIEMHNATSAREVFKLAKKYKNIRRKDWNDIKDDIMEIALIAKFTQNEDLKKLLISTNDKILVEASPYDNYWGYGPDEKGKNMLGILLMKVRDILIE